MTDVAAPMAPRIYAKGFLRTVRDASAKGVAVAVSIYDGTISDGGKEYGLLGDVVYSQSASFPVSITGGWTAELVHAPGLVYQIACPGWMQTVYLSCDAHPVDPVTKQVTVRYADMARVAPGRGLTVTENVDGTWTFTGQAVANPDGTYTIS